MTAQLWIHLPLLGLLLGGCTATSDAPALAGADKNTWADGPRVPL